MNRIVWDQVGSRKYEVGVDRGVLYEDTPDGFTNGVAWNGLVSVDTDSGDSDITPLYSGDVLIDYVSSYDEVSGTITAYTYPDEFEPCIGSMEVISGIFLQQQDKTRFGLCYRSGMGDDIKEEAGYRLHLIYNCELSNNSRSRSTINDSLELEELAFEFKTIPVVSDEYDPYSEIVIDSTKFSSEFMEQLEDILYGTNEEPPRLPDLDELIELFEVIDTSIPPEYEGYPYMFLLPAEDLYPRDDRYSRTYTIAMYSGIELQPHESRTYFTINIVDGAEAPIIPIASRNISFIYPSLSGDLANLTMESSLSDDYMRMYTTITNDSDESISVSGRVNIGITIKYMWEQEG